jgi:hypothetical protein
MSAVMEGRTFHGRSTRLLLTGFAVVSAIAAAVLVLATSLFGDLAAGLYEDASAGLREQPALLRLLNLAPGPRAGGHLDLPAGDKGSQMINPLLRVLAVIVVVCELRGGFEESLAAKFTVLFPHLDERQRRLLMGAEARALGHGGIRLVARAAGVREATVALGVTELDSGEEPLGRARRPGGGRKRVTDQEPGLRPALLALVEPDTRGDPMSPLRWTTKAGPQAGCGADGAGAPGIGGHGR